MSGLPLSVLPQHSAQGRIKIPKITGKEPFTFLPKIPILTETLRKEKMKKMPPHPILPQHSGIYPILIGGKATTLNFFPLRFVGVMGVYL